ncbi:MAG TPA: DNA-processing protein DprA [Candidatus Limnocylindrales bacterium]|nr:DNA-processing protein DprA [Candidatus Limnocylindrales bacterium]
MITLRPGDPGYPARLRALPRPPDPLWLSGEVQWDRPTVAIVGTRRMSSYGERVAREIAGAAAEAGAVVVSGLAQGIDATAHAAALERGGATVAVLGEGLDAFTAGVPSRRRALGEAIVRSGALASQYAPDHPASRWSFARRNATIAALGDATVIVEAGEVSGALITAAEARGLGRPVFAVPGPLGARTSRGTNALIVAHEAEALVDVRTLLRVLGLDSPTPLAPARPPGDPILEALAGGAAPPDVLAARAGLDPATFASRLARLLISGAVITLGDGRLARR